MPTLKSPRTMKEKNDSIAHTLSEIEIINFVQTQINDSEQSCLDINMVDCMFNEILHANGEANASKDYKKKLKELIMLEAILEDVFKNKNKKINQSKLYHKELNQTQ